MICVDCGYANDPMDRFCGSCGAHLPLPPAVPDAITTIIPAVGSTATGPLAAMSTGRMEGLPEGDAMLVVHRGPGEGAEFILRAADGVHAVGRSPEAEVFLDDVTVSRRHAEFRHGAQGWSVRDVGSLNGTYVNRTRVEDRALRGGDEVQIGKFRFAFLVASQATS
jgi:pSer/pThr/pTyr-binding forkhead associated (FHA) protein